MSILSGLFSADSGNSSDFLGVLDLTGSVGIDYSTSSTVTDDDGSTESYSSSGSIGGDFDLGSMLGSAADSWSDADGGAGLF